MLKKIVMATLLFASFAGGSNAEDGYDLWLRYKKCDQPDLLASYRNHFSGIFLAGNHPSIDAAFSEMVHGLSGIMDKNIPLLKSPQEGAILIGTVTELFPHLQKLSPSFKMPVVPKKKGGLCGGQNALQTTRAHHHHFNFTNRCPIRQLSPVAIAAEPDPCCKISSQ